MKVINIMMKNYRVLFRSKASAAVVVLGPLLIILLVGLAFNNSQSFTVNVGTFNPDNSALTSEFINNLAEDEYRMFNYTSQEECVQKIREGIIHVCVSFPKDFTIENNKVNNVSIFVDNSRQNLVYQVIENIKSTVQESSSEVSVELTGDLITAIQNAQTRTSTNLNKIIVLKTSADEVATDSGSIKSSSNTIDLETGAISLSGIISSLEALQEDLEEIGSQAAAAEDVKDSYSPGGNFTSDMNGIIEDLEDLENESIENVNDVIATVNTASSNIASLEEKITIAKTAKTNINAKADSITTKTTAIKSDLDSVKAELELIQQSINSLTVTDAENIVNPVELSVQNVSADNTSLKFLFPFLLILVIMFVSILLSSTLIVLEKSGRAFFRNFTTSTKDEVFIFSTFMTAFCLVLAQVIVLMAAGSFVLKNPIFGTFWVTLLIIILSTALFVMIGMAIGYSFNTQQATNMVSISLGSVFLLLSNLILPIETISPALQALTKLNPYVIASEILRKSLLFEAGFVAVQKEIAMLFLYSVMIFILILMTHKISKIRYLGIMPHKKVLIATLGEGDAFEIGDKFSIKNKEELYVALVEMDDSDFSTFIESNRKEYIMWLKDSLKDPTLAKKFKKANRENMITFLDRVVDKNKLPHTKEFLQKKKEEQKREEEAKAFQKEPEENLEKPKKKKKSLFKKNKEDKSPDEKNDEEKVN